MNVDFRILPYRSGWSLFALLMFAASTAMGNPVHFPVTGNYYEYIEGLMDWEEALAAADTFTFQGVPGHLATITSEEENDFVTTTFGTGVGDFFAWLAGHEPEDDGVWLWGAGPERGVQFSDDATPTAPYFYVNWGGVEPNDHVAGEDFMAINLGGTFGNILQGEWIDSPNPNPADPILGYLVEYETATSILESDAENEIFPQPAVLTACPNPFNPTTEIRFRIKNDAVAVLTLFDIGGRRIAKLVDEYMSAGEHSITWNGQDHRGGAVPSGVYFARLMTDSEMLIRKLTLIR